jgi:hypothetical protein
MKAIITIALIIILAAAGFLIYRSSAWETYAAQGYNIQDEDYKSIKISELHSNPEKFPVEKIIIEGKISRECPTGCWFYLQDENGESIKVDLASGRFVIPRSSGKSVRTFGTAEIVNGQPVIIADKVQIR